MGDVIDGAVGAADPGDLGLADIAPAHYDGDAFDAMLEYAVSPDAHEVDDSLVPADAGDVDSIPLSDDVGDPFADSPDDGEGDGGDGDGVDAGAPGAAAPGWGADDDLDFALDTDPAAGGDPVAGAGFAGGPDAGGPDPADDSFGDSDYPTGADW